MSKEKILRKLNRYKVMRDSFGGGNLNELVLLKDQKGKKYILQIEKEDKPIKEYLAELFETIGIGNQCRFRSISEQVKFTQLCLENDLLVPKIFDYGINYLVREFIDGSIYSELLKELEYPLIIKRYLNEIIKIHEKGIIIGDRWGPNEVLTPNNKLYFFDFDIELTTENAKEFEIAHASYYSIANAKNKEYALNILLDLFKNKINNSYDINEVLQFLQNHTVFYEKKDKHHKTNILINNLERRMGF